LLVEAPPLRSSIGYILVVCRSVVSLKCFQDVGEDDPASTSKANPDDNVREYHEIETPSISNAFPDRFLLKLVASCVMIE
jgi:hypothetical protein